VNQAAPSSPLVVLVVEDEPLIRMMAMDMVEDAGFIALGAADANQAIALLEARSDIRLVFTDIDLPGSLDGMRLAACVRDRWPPVEIIVTSGRPVPQGSILPDRGQFLPKPYAQGELVRMMQGLLH